MVATSSDKPVVLFVDGAPWFGGAQRSLETLVRALASGDEFTPVVLAADQSSSGLLDRLRSRGVLARPLELRHWSLSVSGLTHFLLDLRRARPRVRSLVHTVSPALIHANSLRAALTILLCGIRRVPVLLHGRDVREPRFIRRWVGQRLSGLIAVSNFVVDTWDGLLPAPALTAVIPNGFDLREFASVSPAPSPFPPDHPVLIQVADLVTWKRHDLFVRAFGLVHNQRPEVRGLVVGRPVARDSRDLLARLKRLARTTGAARDLQFITDEQDARARIAGAAALVSCSEREPFGRAIVEALALGKPVAAVDEGGPAEILRDCPVGFLARPRLTELAHAILDALDAAGRTGTARTARASAERYDIRRILPRVTHFYRDVLERRQ